MNREFPITLFKGMLNSTLTLAYQCPVSRVAEITSIHLANTSPDTDLTIQCVPIVSGGTVPYIPQQFTLKAKHTCELVDNPDGGPSLKEGDLLQLGAAQSQLVSCWVQGFERPVK